MSLLKQIIAKVNAGVDNNDLAKELAPLLSSGIGRIFNGLYLEDVKFLLNCVPEEDLLDKTEGQLLDYLAQQRVYYFESLAPQLVAVVCRSEKVTLTDSEFQKIKDEAPSLVGKRNKEQFVAVINKDPNSFAGKVLEHVPASKLLPVREITNPLYAFFHELATTNTKNEYGGFNLNERLVSDSNRISEIIHGLKTGAHTPPLNGKVSTKIFFDVAHALFASKKLVRSLFPNTLVMEFNGKLRDYSEAEFQEHFIETANFLFTVMNSIGIPNVCASSKKDLEESSNPLYSYVRLLLANSKLCSHGKLLANDEIISDYELINIVLKDLKEKTRTTKDGRELPKLNESINELQFINVLKQIIHTQKICCAFNSSTKLTYNDNGAMKELGDLTLVNHVVKELNKLVLETPQYPPSAHTASTSMSASSSSSTTSSAVVPPAVASVVLGSAASDKGRI